MSAIHNPDRLTQAQLGEGFRFLEEEPAGMNEIWSVQGVQFWSCASEQWFDVTTGIILSPAGSYTYRVPAETPVGAAGYTPEQTARQRAFLAEMDAEIRDDLPDGTPVAGVECYLHGYMMDSPGDRQKTAEGHYLWPAFVDYWRSRYTGGVSMDDPECRQIFEIYVEGATQEALFVRDKQPPPAPDARAEFEAWWMSEDYVESEIEERGVERGALLVWKAAWQAATARAEGRVAEILRALVFCRSFEQVEAQHNETERLWKGLRRDLPDRYFVISNQFGITDEEWKSLTEGKI